MPLIDLIALFIENPDVLHQALADPHLAWQMLTDPGFSIGYLGEAGTDQGEAQ